MLNGSGKGKQIDLDRGEAQILEGRIFDDFFYPCTQLEVVFETTEKLVFNNSSDCYITSHGIDWIPTDYMETKGSGNSWHYDCICYPMNVFDVVSKPCENTQVLARALKLDLTTNSSSLKIKCPIIGYYAGELINEIRYQSLNEAYNDKDMGEAYFIYMSNPQMLSVTMKQLVNQEALKFEFPDIAVGQNRVTFINKQMDTQFSTAHGAHIWTQGDFLKKMIGYQFEIESPVAAVFSKTYTISLSDTPEFDTGETYLCVRVEKNIMEGTYTNVFAQIKYIN